MGVAPSVEHLQLLKSLEYDVLFDVGANRGQFSLSAILAHPRRPIHAFEPQSGEAEVYRKAVGEGGLISLHRVALGEASGEAELHLSRKRDSSSLLPIGELQVKMSPGTDEVGTEAVEVVTLDSLRSLWSGCSRMLLKLDVQGFELSVLKGSAEALRHCAYVYAECSNVPLYRGQALYPEVAEFLAKHGFRPVRQLNEHMEGGVVIQADYLFAR
jgi:FkbM family methyltransferase